VKRDRIQWFLLACMFAALLALHLKVGPLAGPAMNPVTPTAHLANLPIGRLIQANLSGAFLVNAPSGPAAFYELPDSGIVRIEHRCSRLA